MQILKKYDRDFKGLKYYQIRNAGGEGMNFLYSVF